MRKKKIDTKSQDPNIEPQENGERDGDPEANAKENSGVSRRNFLLAGSSAAAAVIATHQLLANAQQGRGRGRGTGRGGGRPQQGKGVNALSGGGTSATSPVFSEPDVATARYDPQSATNVVSYNLNAALFDLRFTCNGQTSYAPQVPIFNTKVPGPTFYVDPGGLMAFTLTNNLNASFPGDKCTMGTIHAAEMQGEEHACPSPTPTPSPGASPTPAPLPAPKPGCFNHTNLHTHGLMVSPCSIDKNNKPTCGAITSDKLLNSSDDVLVDIPPGGSNNYRIFLPSFHAPGTHWYHSHLHGASGWQVSSGMAGAIIVREPYGREFLQADRDSVFLMQEVIFGTADGQFPAVYSQTTTSATQTSGFLLNGECKPTLQIVAGVNYRWRFINGTATPRGLLKLRLVKCSSTPTANCDDSIPPPPTPSTPNTLMYLIAVDGVSFYGFSPQPVREHLIGPGNRADFLINVLEPGKYKLVKDAFPTDATTAWDYTNVVQPTKTTAQVLAFIEVNKRYGPPENIPPVIPGERPLYLQAIDKVDRSGRQIVFFSDNQSGGGGVLGGRFQMNYNYYPCNDDFVVPLNTAEEVTVQNLGPVGAGQMPHTFHIHVNPFQMVGRAIDFEVQDADLSNPTVTRLPNRTRLDPTNSCNWMWMDTLALPPNASTVRSRFLVYNGEYVSHCHLLIHEDVGMMMNVKINGDGIPPNQPLKDYPPAALACINRTMKKC
jgi:L-ascorbate oxidase